MDADTFVARLQAYNSPEDELPERADGVQCEIDPVTAPFFCRRRPGMPGSADKNPIIDLVLRYDLSSIDFGLVTFRSEIQDLDGKLWFGEAAGDLLAIDRETLRVQLLDHGAPEYVMCDCAITAERFLDAMIAYLTEPWMEVDLFEEDPPLEPPRSLRLAEIAGGTEYMPFYESILGLGLDE